ncbi:MAG: hypothetical protein HYW70_00905 [Candidatus Nealsonbacteria bacterium]|nr:hypothetical protein [Candidatus Nealsonbacteria bacterium]
MRKEKFVIPGAMLPKKGIEGKEGFDGKTYLVRNEAMFTAFRHSQGEFSQFFKALRDDARILGNRCPKCRVLICPPFQNRCPDCNFAEMQSEIMPDTGLMAASPVIVIFAPARFKADVPYGLGYAFLGKSDCALPLRVKTTTGMIRPGILEKHTLVKIVFRNKRQGEMLDIFALPQTELTLEQIQKSPLLESEISFETPREPEFGEKTQKLVFAKNRLVKQLRLLSERIKKSPRAQKDLANWRRLVKIKTAGGDFGILIDNGKLEVIEGDIFDPNLVFAIENPSKLRMDSALTNLVMEGSLWVNKSELETITRLDRLYRSLKRDSC